MLKMIYGQRDTYPSGSEDILCPKKPQTKPQKQTKPNQT